MAKITVLSKEITVQSQHKTDYISLTDIACYKSLNRTDDLIRNWIRNRNTIEFLGIWERLNNPAFKPVEFDGFRKLAGLNSFTLTPKQWIEATSAIGIVSKAGRYGGTYAHKDIASEFAIKEFQRLKDQEQKQLGWDIRRNPSHPGEKGNIRDYANVSQLVLRPLECVRVTPANRQKRSLTVAAR